jgi:hypothetical protein
VEELGFIFEAMKIRGVAALVGTKSTSRVNLSQFRWCFNVSTHILPFIVYPFYFRSIGTTLSMTEKMFFSFRP